MRKVYRTDEEWKEVVRLQNQRYRAANADKLNAYDKARKGTEEHKAKRREQHHEKMAPIRAQKQLEKLNAPPPPPITEKLCPSCNPPIPKSVSEFGVDNGRKDKLAPYCKECTAKRQHARLDKRREYDYNRPPEEKQTRHETIGIWRHAHPLAVQGYQLQRLARKKGAGVIEKVDLADILEWYGRHCYICDKPILSHHTLTFDHIVPLVPRPGEPAGTHTSDNILPAHQECNARKSNRSLEDLSDFDKRGVDY